MQIRNVNVRFLLVAKHAFVKSYNFPIQGDTRFADLHNDSVSP